MTIDNARQAHDAILDNDAPLTERIAAVEFVGKEELERGGFASMTGSPSTRKDVKMAAPALVDSLSLHDVTHGVRRLVRSRYFVMLASLALVIVMLVVMIFVSTEDAAPYLEWLQSWLP